MDLARTLIRSTVRAFYETRHVLVIDALMVHSALPNEELAILLGMQQKDLRKLCARLREDRLMTTHVRQEFREGQQRPVNRDYYYINFHNTIDAIKYRVFYLTQKVKNMYKSNEERKDFKCPRCGSSWSQFEVLDNCGPEGFLCHRCGGLLERDESADGESGGHEIQSKLMGQLEKLLKLLQQVDSAEIPQNDFESALAAAIPVKRNEDTNPTRPLAPTDVSRIQPATVRGVAQAAAPLEISLTTNSEKTAAEQAAEAQRKAAIAAQNVLPDWIRSSTITGERTAVGIAEQDRIANSASLDISKTEEDEKKDTTVLNDELAAYYAQMQAEKEKEALEDRDESSGEEEDEFEDVGIDATNASTPASSGSGAATGPKNGLLSGILKRQASDSDNSVPRTGTATPAGSQPLTAEDTGRPAKKVRIEEQENGGLEENKTTQADKVSDEDDEGDFEDAL